MRVFRIFFSILLFLTAASVAAYEVAQGKIRDHDGQAVALHGVNWFGFETQNHVAHGLWARNWREMITQMREQGFTAVRVPVCPDTLRGVAVDSVDYGRNPDLQGLDSLQVLDLVLAEMDSQGMYILLDHHRPDCDAISTLWYTDHYSEEAWIADLVAMAERYQALPRFLGLDLKNEPHGEATWGTGNAATDWNLAAERAAKAVLAANPNLLIFVEGVAENSVCSGSVNHWWGGNLEPQRCHPLDIPADKLVLSPHVYGPDVFVQDYFNASDFPANLPAIWDAHFGDFASQGFSVIPGEFGGKYGQGDGRDKVWQDALVDYLLEKGMTDFFYWSWNPNSGDTGGVLQDDWQTVRDDKMALLRRLMGGQPVSPTPSPDPVTNDPDPTTPSDPQQPQDPPADPDPAPSTESGSVVLTQGTCELVYTVRSEWDQGLVADLRVRNLSDQAQTGWRVQWQLAEGARLDNYWNIGLTQAASATTSPLSWNRVIPARGEANFGLQLGFAAPLAEPIRLLGVDCGDALSSAPSAPETPSADYQAGLAAGKAFCAENPGACDIPRCDAGASFHPETGALFLPGVELTNLPDSDLRWDVYLQRIGVDLVFEVKGLAVRAEANSTP